MRRKGNPVHGWVLVDKPLGLTSTQALNRVRRAFNAQKAGHAGTLDPQATGMLPIALGEATKAVPYVMDGRKSYLFTVCWGEARSTDDTEGEVVAISAHRPSEEEIRDILPRFEGQIMQAPPAYSAIKVEGERAYDLARAGQPIELPPRPVFVESLEFLGCLDASHAQFRVCCGKGFYVRSLARDLALALGTVGHVTTLRRTSVGPFAQEHMISLDEIEESGHVSGPYAYLLPVETALDDIPALALTAAETHRIRQGQHLALFSRQDVERLKTAGLVPGGLPCMARAVSGGTLVGMVEVAGAEVRPVRLFNLEEDR